MEHSTDERLANNPERAALKSRTKLPDHHSFMGHPWFTTEGIQDYKVIPVVWVRWAWVQALDFSIDMLVEANRIAVEEVKN